MKILDKVLKKIKPKTMNKEDAIKRLNALDKESAELRKLIEEPVNITDRIKDYNDILSIGNYDESKDVIRIDNFDSEEHLLVKNFIKKVRCAKVYRDGKDAPRRGDERWYPYYSVSSGFAFSAAAFDTANALTFSSSRLCFLSEERTKDYVKKFKSVDEEFIGLK